MIRIDGDIKEAKEIEDLIKNGTLYLSIPFGVRLRHIGMNGQFAQGNEASRCFTKEYEVFGSPNDVKRVSGSKEKWVRELTLWLTRENMNITFKYDYRVEKCEIIVSCDSWVKLCKLLPQLKGRVRIIEPNRCELVKQGIA